MPLRRKWFLQHKMSNLLETSIEMKKLKIVVCQTAAAKVADQFSHLDMLLNVTGILHIPGKLSPGIASYASYRFSLVGPFHNICYYDIRGSHIPRSGCLPAAAGWVGGVGGWVCRGGGGEGGLTCFLMHWQIGAQFIFCGHCRDCTVKSDS